MNRINTLFVTLFVAFLGLAFGVGVISAETRVPQGNTIDCIPGRSGVVTPTAYLVGTVWHETGRPDGIFELGETKVNTVTIRGTCSTESGGKTSTVITTPGADQLASGTFSIPINATGAPTDTVYEIEVELPQGNRPIFFTWQNVGDDDAVDSDVSTRGTARFDIPAATAFADSIVNIDVGLTSAEPDNTVSGQVWQEDTVNGLLDASETFVGDVLMSLRCPSLIPQNAISTTTESDGRYAFSIWYTPTVVSEMCQLVIVPPENFELTEDNVSANGILNSDFDPDTGVATVTLSTTDPTPTRDAGLVAMVPLAASLVSQYVHGQSTIFFPLMGLILFTVALWRRQRAT